MEQQTHPQHLNHSAPLVPSEKLQLAEAERVLRDAARIAEQNRERASKAEPARVRPIQPGPTQSRLDTLDLIERRTQYDNRIDAANIPKKFKDVPREPEWAKLPEAVDGVPVREPYRGAFAELCAIESMPGGGIVALLGDRGPGKTWMACCMVKRFCAAGMMAQYREAMDYFVELRATYGDRGRGTEMDVEARYLRPHLLVLDAVEEKSDSPSQQQMLTRLINKRMMAERITLLVSNDNGESLPSRIGPSLNDRLNDGGGLIECNWPSLRGHV